MQFTAWLPSNLDFKPIFGWLSSVFKDGTQHQTDSNGSNAKAEAKNLYKEKNASSDTTKARAKGF